MSDVRLFEFNELFVNGGTVLYRFVNSSDYESVIKQRDAALAEFAALRTEFDNLKSKLEHKETKNQWLLHNNKKLVQERDEYRAALVKAEKDLRNYWFESDSDGESYNNPDAIEASKAIEKVLAKYEGDK